MGSVVVRKKVCSLQLNTNQVKEGNSRERSNTDTDLSLLSKRYQCIRTIGTGSYSTVQVAKDLQTGLFVVLKTMSKIHIIRKGQVDHVKNEQGILRKLKSEFVVQLETCMQDDRYLYLVLELVQGGEMFRYLGVRGVLSEGEIRFYAAELVVAIEYLHSKNITYRDLKPENILLTASGHVKLTDFGFAKVIPASERTFTLCGTPEYLAPEIVDRVGHDTQVDWWQLGVLLYEMLYGYTPFRDPNPYQLYTNILSNDPVFPDCSPCIQSLLSALLTKPPSNRLSDSAIRSHPFFTGIDWELVQQLRLKPPYEPRITGSTDLSHFDVYKEVKETPASVLIDVFPEFK